MPLLKRKPYTLEPPPRDLKPDETVYQVRHTKEIFRDYEYPQKCFSQIGLWEFVEVSERERELPVLFPCVPFFR